MGRLTHDYAAEIRRTLVDPRRLCDRLGLSKGAQPQSGGGMIVRCPAHQEKTPSCSVRCARDGTISVRCFACDWSGDALSLVAQVHGLDIRKQFREVLLEAAVVAGLHSAVDELRGDRPYVPRECPPAPPMAPERDYPPAASVAALWAAGAPASEDEESAWHLEGRGIDPREASRYGLVRSVVHAPLPDWARYRGEPWPAAGFRLVVPAYDSTGALRSVRAWRTVEGDGPKRLPPAGHRATGLVMANDRARRVLTGETTGPTRIVVVEGEPDAVSVALRWPWCAVLGVYSGSWTKDFAERIPLGSEVIVRTHHDDAGEKYAAEIVKSTKARAVVRRSEAA